MRQSGVDFAFLLFSLLVQAPTLLLLLLASFTDIINTLASLNFRQGQKTSGLQGFPRPQARLALLRLPVWQTEQLLASSACDSHGAVPSPLT